MIEEQVVIVAEEPLVLLFVRICYNGFNGTHISQNSLLDISPMYLSKIGLLSI